MNGADRLSGVLLANGVDVCFANPGTSEMHFVAALDRKPAMCCVLGLFEGVVTGAADVYSRRARSAATLLHTAPDTLLVAAGGVADGRSLAAALMLGADGVLFGSRIFASYEAATPQGFYSAIIAADGDSTIKTAVTDIVRNYDWPGDEFSVRGLDNRFVTEWHGREEALAEASTNEAESELYWKTYRSGDADCSGVIIGEAGG